MIVFGIDPGKNGAVAWINTEYHTSNAIKMPDDELEISSFIHEQAQNTTSLCYIEKAQSMPKQGIVSVFNYGKHYGKLIAILRLIGIPFYEVASQTWKKNMGLTHEKSLSIIRARQLFPHLSDLLKTKSSDGIAEALLLAEYGRKMQM